HRTDRGAARLRDERQGHHSRRPDDVGNDAGALMRVFAGIFTALMALHWAPAAANTVVAAHLIRAQTVISAADLAVVPGDVAGAAQHPDELVGLEARAMLYPGRPITIDQVGAPALVERNQMVALIYVSGGLMIETEGRSLDRAGEGDPVKVMNLSSKKTVM